MLLPTHTRCANIYKSYDYKTIKESTKLIYTFFLLSFIHEKKKRFFLLDANKLENEKCIKRENEMEERDGKYL